MKKLHDVQSEVASGAVIDPTRITVADYLSQWLKGAAHTIRPNKLESYARSLKTHIIPTLGHIQLAKLQPLQVQSLYNERLDSGKSRRTVQYAHAILHRALDQAVKLGMLIRNPADAVDAPRPAKKEIQVLSPEQVSHLLV
jgi:integrase